MARLDTYLQIARLIQQETGSFKGPIPRNLAVRIVTLGYRASAPTYNYN